MICTISVLLLGFLTMKILYILGLSRTILENFHIEIGTVGKKLHIFRLKFVCFVDRILANGAS